MYKKRTKTAKKYFFMINGNEKRPADAGRCSFFRYFLNACNRSSVFSLCMQKYSAL